MMSKCFPVLLLLLFVQLTGGAQPAPFAKQLAAATTDSQRLDIYRSLFSYYKNINTDTARLYMEEGLQRFTKSNYTYGRAAMLGMLSGGYSEQGMVLAATQAGQESLRLFTELKDGAGMAKAHNSLGVTEGRKGNFNEAIKHFLQALRYFERVGDTANIINTYVKLGTANNFMQNADKALWYYNKGLELSLRMEVSANTAHLYNNIGTIYARQQKMDTALIYFNKALEIGMQPQFVQASVAALMNLGQVYVHKGDKRQALHYYQRGLEAARTTGLREDAAKLLHNIGELESEGTGRVSPALHQALEMAKEGGNKTLQADILNDMAHIAGEAGRHREEAAYLRAVMQLRDSVYNVEKAREIANLQAEYDLSKSQAKLEALNVSMQENRQKKNLTIAVAVLLGAMLGIVFFMYLRGRKLNKELGRRGEELQNANRIKDRLFSIIGHDLKGSIGNIPVLLDIYRSDIPEEERTYILDSLEENSIASLETLDKLLNWGKLQIKGHMLNQQPVAVEAVMEDTLRLLRVTATGKNISFANRIPHGLRVYADENHFKFVMRNLLFNAVKYSRPGGAIEIAAAEQEGTGKIVFSVKDNGVGIPEGKQADIFERHNTSTAGTADETGNSIGLMLCREFIHQNGGEIWVESEEGKGATFYFTVAKATPAPVPQPAAVA